MAVKIKVCFSNLHHKQWFLCQQFIHHNFLMTWFFNRQFFLITAEISNPWSFARDFPHFDEKTTHFCNQHKRFNSCFAQQILTWFSALQMWFSVYKCFSHILEKKLLFSYFQRKYVQITFFAFTRDFPHFWNIFLENLDFQRNHVQSFMGYHFHGENLQ